VPDIATVTTAISSVKAALEIAKLICDMDKSISDAEWKLKIADLMSNLAESQVSLYEIKLLLVEKDNEIRELNDLLRNKGKVAKDGDSYFEVDNSGNLVGSAYCMKCYETQNMLVHTAQVPIDRKISMCPQCKSTHNWRPSK